MTQAFFGVFKYVVCGGFKESNMRSACGKLFGDPGDATLTAQSYISAVINNQLVECADPLRSKRKGSIYIERRREKVNSLFLRIAEGTTVLQTLPDGHLLAGFGVFGLRSGGGKPLFICLSAGWCGGCPMHCETCKHLMAVRLYWLSKQQQPVWFDRELDTIIPRSRFSYPPKGAPEPPTCLILQRRPISALHSARGDAAAPAQPIMGLVSEISASAAAGHRSAVSSTALAVVSRLDSLQKSIAASVRRLRRLHVSQTSADVEAIFGGALLQVAEQFSGLLSAGVRSLEASAPTSVLLPESEGDVRTHNDSRLLHRHKGSLGRVRFRQKSDHPKRAERRQRLASRTQAAEDSGEEDVPLAEGPTQTAHAAAPLPARLGTNTEAGRQRHKSDKKARLPRNSHGRSVSEHALHEPIQVRWAVQCLFSVSVTVGYLLLVWANTEAVI
jgi:hypothetical protein